MGTTATVHVGGSCVANVKLDDFRPAASEAVSTGTAAGGVPAYEIVVEKRPLGSRWDRGAFESRP
jgi:hypothetical protein